MPGLLGWRMLAYKADILARISSDIYSQRIQEMVEAILKALEEGDKRRGGEPALSLIQYEAASEIVGSDPFTHEGPALEEGYYAGWRPSRCVPPGETCFVG